MSDIKTLKVTNAEAFARYNQLKIRLAGSLSRIPTTNDLIRALTDIGTTHYDELLAALAAPETRD